MDASVPLKKRSASVSPNGSASAQHLEHMEGGTRVPLLPGGASRQEPASHLPNWLFVPTLAILLTLLLTSCWLLRLEQSQVQGQEYTIKELKSQLRALREEALTTKVMSHCGSASVTKLQDELHKLERSSEGLRAGKLEVEKQLQEMVSRVSLLQNERNKLKAALRAMKQELNEAAEEGQSSSSSKSRSS